MAPAPIGGVPGQTIGDLAKFLAGPGVPGAASPAKVRSIIADIQGVSSTVNYSNPDVFQTFRGVRDAMLIHCPAGLNHAISLAKSIRTVTR